MGKNQLGTEVAPCFEGLGTPWEMTAGIPGGLSNGTYAGQDSPHQPGATSSSPTLVLQAFSSFLVGEVTLAAQTRPSHEAQAPG